MKRKIEDVQCISIAENVISIYHGTPIPKRFERDKWVLYVEDISKLEDNHREALHKISHPSTLIHVRAGIGVSCQILEDEKVILCGERPEKMFVD